MKVQLLVTAAGLGTRLGESLPKALVCLAQKPLLIHTLERFIPMGLASRALVTVPPDYLDHFQKELAEFSCRHQLQLIPGGEERQDSVANGLEALEPDTDIVVIHDAARPFVPETSVRASIDAAREWGASTVAIPAIDTILRADHDDFLVETPDRKTLWACQTPQTFQVRVIRDAHAWAKQTGFNGTDDATLVRAMGKPVKLVNGSPMNYKITTPEDKLIAELLIEKHYA